MATSEIAHLTSELRPLGDVPAETYEPLVKLCAGVAAGRKEPADALRAAALAGVDDEVAEVLIALFLEATRLGVTTEALESALASVLPAERARGLAGLASEAQSSIASTLEAVGSGPDELLDVSWTRASVDMSSGQRIRAYGIPLYTVTLTTRTPAGEMKPIQFCATLEGLTDLVAQLKAAAHQAVLCEKSE
jgi:hypothetical protein